MEILERKYKPLTVINENKKIARKILSA